MEQTLETAQLEQKEVIIMGDISIDWLHEQAKEEEWQRVVEAFQMTQVIGEPTPVTASTETLIDHIYTTHPRHVRAEPAQLVPCLPATTFQCPCLGSTTLH